jgi:predicted nuclease of predicted toxin-antitoxin system
VACGGDGATGGALENSGAAHAKDREIFTAACAANALLITKDADFVEMVQRLGPPPAIIWLTCGNTSNNALRSLFKTALPRATELIAGGESLVEISDPGFP